jgi:hypothetical protein
MYWELKKYLGLPFMIRKETFAYVKDRICKRINSLRGPALSKVGKEVTGKFILQVIPSCHEYLFTTEYLY